MKLSSIIIFLMMFASTHLFSAPALAGSNEFERYEYQSVFPLGRSISVFRPSASKVYRVATDDLVIERFNAQHMEINLISGKLDIHFHAPNKFLTDGKVSDNWTDGVRLFKIEDKLNMFWAGRVNEFLAIQSSHQGRNDMYIYNMEYGIIAIFLDYTLDGCENCYYSKDTYILNGDVYGFGKLQ